MKTLLALALFAPLAAAAGTMQVVVITADGKLAADTVVQLLPDRGVGLHPGSDPVVITQKDIRFQPYVSVVPLGGTVRFVNLDGYDHHVRSLPSGPLGSMPPAMQFDFRLPAARGTAQPGANVKADTAGAITLGCHLHGSMRAHLYVSPSPWVAVTNAAGQVTIKDVPDGDATLQLWHPDQLTVQPPQRLQVAGNATANAKLNFNPRRRPLPPKKGEYDID
jgi:plastocyanin